DLPVKFHAENTPALPANRKGQSGKVLLCPQQDNLATSVAHFCIAVLISERKSKKPSVVGWVIGQRRKLPIERSR
ncbi:MAG: hypothetical protein KBT65_07960, partial [Sulfitobacter sp.]|nr:hypothetical protein [Sulfitobacter sp.]